MSGPFDSGDKDGSENSGKGGPLPKHIERMNAGTRAPKMKSGSEGNLPWGGKSKEASKTYMSGLPKSKGSTTSKNNGKPKDGFAKARQGKSPTIKSAPQKLGK